MKEPGCDYETECVFLLIKKGFEKFWGPEATLQLRNTALPQNFLKKYLTKQRLYDILYLFG